jgi:hypothetical protein
LAADLSTGRTYRPGLINGELKYTLCEPSVELLWGKRGSSRTIAACVNRLVTSDESLLKKTLVLRKSLHIFIKRRNSKLWSIIEALTLTVLGCLSPAYTFFSIEWAR